MARSKAKRQWFTVAYVTIEGQPCPAHSSSNFTKVYRSLVMLLEDLCYSMSHELGRRGAYAAVVWPGQLSEWEAMHSDIKPLYNVYEDGQIYDVTEDRLVKEDDNA